MNRLINLIVGGASVLCIHFGFADSCSPTCKPCCPPVCFERGYPDTQCCIPSGYNEPANFELSPCPWNLWFDASFTYWTAYEDGSEVAESINVASGPLAFIFKTDVATLFTTSGGNTWKPGFKVGFGFNWDHDHWSSFGEYTWFRSRVSFSDATAPDSQFWQFSNWDLSGVFTYPFQSISAVSRINMDILDVGLTRPYYQGSHVIIAPFGGIRATWIRQNYRFTGAQRPPFALPNPVMHNKSNSWAIGARGGLNGKWHLGWGFRIESDVAATLSFTRYTTIATAADPLQVGGVVNVTTASANITDYNTIRFNNDMNLGLGWGDYFDCRNYHFDLLVSYDFQIFWNQNMMRYLVDTFSSGTGGSPNNLYLQGLTVKAQFDF